MDAAALALWRLIFELQQFIIKLRDETNCNATANFRNDIGVQGALRLSSALQTPKVMSTTVTRTLTATATFKYKRKGYENSKHIK